MGIKTTRTIYTSDRGQEFAVEEMQSTHLMNAINHHQKQLDLIEGMISGNTEYDGFLPQREADLKDTISTLKLELTKRNPDEDDKVGNPYDADNWRY